MRLPLTPLLAVLALTASGCGLPGLLADQKPVVISGTLTIRGGESANGKNGEECVMSGGYKDIQEGAQVVVTDADGKTITVGRLGAGTLHRPDGTGYPSRRCKFSFAVTAPGGHNVYGVEVSHRGRLQYTVDELKSPLELTLDG